MLVTLKEIMRLAEEKEMAVGAFNCPNLESLQAIIDAAEELELPVILQFAQSHEDWIPLALIGPIMVEAAKKAAVPVCVHLDHGETLDYLRQALSLGFTGIMYDGSTLPYEENVANAKLAVMMAAEAGASVEAELGSMGRRESGSGDGSGEDDDTKIYTDPVKAKHFVEETGIDALACSLWHNAWHLLKRAAAEFRYRPGGAESGGRDSCGDARRLGRLRGGFQRGN